MCRGGFSLLLPNYNSGNAVYALRAGLASSTFSSTDSEIVSNAEYALRNFLTGASSTTASSEISVTSSEILSAVSSSKDSQVSHFFSPSSLIIISYFIANW